MCLVLSILMSILSTSQLGVVMVECWTLVADGSLVRAAVWMLLGLVTVCRHE